MAHEASATGPIRYETVRVWGGKIEMRVQVAGNGPPLVYFHPAGGLHWDEFVAGLAKQFTVYAPELPGTTPGDPYAIYQVDAYTDLLLAYEETLRRLGLHGAHAVGQSMGGMIAADLAATYPGMFSHLVVLAPTGLWRADAPVRIADLYFSPPEAVPAMLFAHPDAPSAAAMFALSASPEEIPAQIGQRVWNLGCAGKFLWPIPDHGLRNRLHRIKTPTLILWGEEDQLVPAVYAGEFAAGIAGSSLKTYSSSGHIVQVDSTDQVLADVRDFLAN